MERPFWEYPHTRDTAEHWRDDKIGPSSDYATPSGTPLVAPFAGTVHPYYNRDMGNAARLVGARYTLHVGHLIELPRARKVGWRDAFATSGNTGFTRGPHVHAYIIVNETGERISFYEWLRDYVNKPTPPKPAKPKPPTRLYLPSYFHYANASDAVAHRNPRGGKYGKGSMLQGEYPIVKRSKGAFQVSSRGNVTKSNPRGLVWVSPVAKKYAR